ncbi:Pol polyprotein [Plakobranchus ocellatus]|uniref:Pol polyprotein n=1 Tax=Plakobranchus ocellatus TaxID=259542 RepID=A0AAV4B637_9GAST|nr:Pol polyprotein [Plakobranchus ocellatus]
MPFSITSAQEVFHKRIHETFEDIEGVETDIDDILVWGKNTKEHDERLRKVLNRCRKINLTLNEKKCHFNKEEIIYLGHKLTQDGVQPDKEKVKAITAMPPPEDKKGMERLVRTVNYMAKFIPNLSTISETIRKLLKKDNQFVWEHEQAKAFEEIKNALTSEKTLGYFNPNEKITLECDSSQFGLGAVVTQRGKPITYASRSLSEDESRYAQIDKELLAVVFGLERFENLTYGQHVTVLSDHKPLEAILNKPICLSPPRLQRMLIRLHKFDITLNYKERKKYVL